MDTNQRAKYRVPWETLAVKKKHDNVKTASLYNKRDPTNANTQKIKKAQSELTNAYVKEQTEYIQDKINKVRNLVEDRHSWIVWQTVNQVIKRKSTSRAKLKTAGQEERLHLWKEHFKNLLGKSLKVTDEPITKIINNQLDIKLGEFTQKLDVVLTEIKKKHESCRSWWNTTRSMENKEITALKLQRHI